MPSVPASPRPSRPRPPAASASALLWPQARAVRHCLVDLNAPSGGGIGLVLIGWERCRPDYDLQRPDYPFHVIEVVVAGRGEVEFGSRRQALGPGACLAYAPGAPCRLRTDPRRPLSKYFLALSGSPVAARLQAVGLAPERVGVLRVLPEVVEILEQMLREGARPGARCQPLCHALLEVLLLKLADELAAAPGGDSLALARLARCRELLERVDEAPPPTLAAVAAEVGLDPSTIHRLFQRHLGVSPYRHALQCRMRRAAELLLQGDVLVKEVARRVGFADAYHFARCFRQIHGVPPRSLRPGRGGKGSPEGYD